MITGRKHLDKHRRNNNFNQKEFDKRVNKQQEQEREEIEKRKRYLGKRKKWILGKKEKKEIKKRTERYIKIKNGGKKITVLNYYFLMINNY